MNEVIRSLIRADYGGFAVCTTFDNSANLGQPWNTEAFTQLVHYFGAEAVEEIVVHQAYFSNADVDNGDRKRKEMQNGRIAEIVSFLRTTEWQPPPPLPTYHQGIHQTIVAHRQSMTVAADDGEQRALVMHMKQSLMAEAVMTFDDVGCRLCTIIRDADVPAFLAMMRDICFLKESESESESESRSASVRRMRTELAVRNANGWTALEVVRFCAHFSPNLGPWAQMEQICLDFMDFFGFQESGFGSGSESGFAVRTLFKHTANLNQEWSRIAVAQLANYFGAGYIHQLIVSEDIVDYYYFVLHLQVKSQNPLHDFD
jgi:hypothetical protein